jgi:outer membrane protein
MFGSAFRTRLLFLTISCLGLCLDLSLARTALGAQTIGAGTPLTLDNAIKLGLANSPKMAAAQSQVTASAARVSQARSGFLPRVDMSESFNRTTNPMWAFGTKLNQEVITTEDFDPASLNDPDAINNFGTSVSVTLPVYDQGRNWIGFSQARLDEKATSLSAERSRQEVIADVVVAYLGVLLAGENLRVVEKTLETARAHDRVVRSRYESGLVVKSDVLRAEVRIAELEQERLQAQSQVEVAKATLNAAMGTEIDQAFCLTTPLEGGAKSPGSLELWISKAFENRPDLQQIRFREMIAREEVKKAKAAHLPGFYLSGSYDINSEDFSDRADNYTLGAVMRLNLFSGLGVDAKVHEAMAKLRETQAMVRQTELGIRLETRQAFFMAQSAHQRIGVAEAAVAQAEEGLRMVRNRYENGLFTIVNLLDAEVALQQARTNYFRSLHDFKVAMAQLNLGAGVIGEDVP